MNTFWTVVVLSIALCATQLVSAKATNEALKEEKIKMSDAGNQHHDDQPNAQTLALFKKFMADNKRSVSWYRVYYMSM